jgi:hypothetical protein
LAAGVGGNIKQCHIEAIGMVGESRSAGLFIQLFNWCLDRSTWLRHGLPCQQAQRQQ